MRTFKISAVFAATILAMSGTAQAFNNSSSNPIKSNQAGSQVGAESKAQSESTSESQENKAVEKNAASGQMETIQVTGSYIEGYGEEDVNGASRLNLKMVEIPQSVSVISSAQIKDFQLNDINAALDTATGVRVERIETDRTYYTARGFDITNFQIDGIGLPLISGNNHADEDTAIYDRVEVIRGANGLMTGVGNPSATVNFIRKRPTKTTEFDLDLTAGSWGKSRIEADYSTAVTKDVGVRFVAVKQKNDSYLDRYSQDKTVVYGFVDIKVSDDTQLSLSHVINDNDATGNTWGANPLFYTDGTATNYDVGTNTSADWSMWDVKKSNTVAELTHFINEDWDVRATYSRKKTDEDSQLFYVYGSPDSTTELGLLGYASEYDHDDEHDLLDVYTTGHFDAFGLQHQVVFGLSYANMDYSDLSLYDYSTPYGFPVMPALPTWDGNTPKPTFLDGKTGADIKTTQKAAYFTARLNLAEGFHTIIGGRFNDWNVEGSSYGVVQDRGDNVFIPYVGAVYQVTPEVSAYASYTETFLSQTEMDINNNILEPITGESAEIGAKAELFDGRLIASAAYFDVEQVNVAKLDPLTADLGPELQRHIGTDGISSTGYEIELAGQIGDSTQVSFGFTDFEIEGDEEVQDYTPETLVKLAITHDLEAIDGLTIGANVNYQSATSRVQGVSTAGDAIGSVIVTEQDSYALVNLMANYEINDTVSVSLNANNVTDEKYINSLYWAQGYYGAPANYSATVSLSF